MATFGDERCRTRRSLWGRAQHVSDNRRRDKQQWGERGRASLSRSLIRRRFLQRCFRTQRSAGRGRKKTGEKMIPFNRGSGFQAERMQNGEPALSPLDLFTSLQLSRESRNYSYQTDVMRPMASLVGTTTLADLQKRQSRKKKQWDVVFGC